MALNIGTFNCNGLNSSFKRGKIFKFLKLNNFDIVFLQETHCSSIKDGQIWGKEWGGKCFWSFGTKFSCGVGIILSPSLKYQVKSFDFDANGRYLILDLNINEVGYRLINVYAPNNAGERKQFITNLSNFLVSKNNIIMGGDFNFVEKSQDVVHHTRERSSVFSVQHSRSYSQ
jgi:exonuclease III